MYEHSPNGSGRYDENVLYCFQGSADDGQPSAGVIADAGGALYGTTRSSSGNNVGTAYCGGTNDDGIVFHIQ